jgi:hypothetical protein
MEETFYIQDDHAPAGSPGIAVFKSCRDVPLTLPNVGDLVTVTGRFGLFDGSLQLAGSAKYMILEQLAVTGSGGTSSSGAYLPAGTPVAIAASDMSYAHLAAGGDPHPEQLGQALSFSNVTVTNRNPMGFTSTSIDGGSTTAGFELSNGVWVDYSLIYNDCIAPLPADAGIALPNGIRGFWDRYHDFYQPLAPTVPVLFPMTCADLQ